MDNSEYILAHRTDDVRALLCVVRMQVLTSPSAFVR